MAELLFSMRLEGRPGIKKNGKRIVNAGRKRTIISSDRYIAWEKITYLKVAEASRKLDIEPIQHYIFAIYVFNFTNHQHEIDTSNGIEGIQDIMQKARIILDDKYIRNHWAEKKFNQPEDSVEIYLIDGLKQDYRDILKECVNV